MTYTYTTHFYGDDLGMIRYWVYHIVVVYTVTVTGISGSWVQNNYI